MNTRTVTITEDEFRALGSAITFFESEIEGVDEPPDYLTNAIKHMETFVSKWHALKDKENTLSRRGET